MVKSKRAKNSPIPKNISTSSGSVRPSSVTRSISATKRTSSSGSSGSGSINNNNNNNGGQFSSSSSSRYLSSSRNSGHIGATVGPVRLPNVPSRVQTNIHNGHTVDPIAAIHMLSEWGNSVANSLLQMQQNLQPLNNFTETFAKPLLHQEIKRARNRSQKLMPSDISEVSNLEYPAHEDGSSSSGGSGSGSGSGGGGGGTEGSHNHNLNEYDKAELLERANSGNAKIIQPLKKQTSFVTTGPSSGGPGFIGPGHLDRLVSMPLVLGQRSRTEDFVFHGGKCDIPPLVSKGPPLLRRESSLGYSQVPLETSGLY